MENQNVNGQTFLNAGNTIDSSCINIEESIKKIIENADLISKNENVDVTNINVACENILKAVSSCKLMGEILKDVGSVYDEV